MDLEKRIFLGGGKVHSVHSCSRRDQSPWTERGNYDRRSASGRRDVRRNRGHRSIGGGGGAQCRPTSPPSHEDDDPHKLGRVGEKAAVLTLLIHSSRVSPLRRGEAKNSSPARSGRDDVQDSSSPGKMALPARARLATQNDNAPRATLYPRKNVAPIACSRGRWQSRARLLN